MEQDRTVYVNERNQTKTKKKQKKVTLHSNWRRVLLFDLVHRQCNSIIKGWLNCLTSESKWRFLANYIISMMSGQSANLVFFNKKNKNWTSRTLANPPPPTSDNISFLSYPTTREFYKILWWVREKSGKCYIIFLS